MSSPSSAARGPRRRSPARNTRKLSGALLLLPELWRIFHDELDLDGNGHLEPQELEVALRKAGAFAGMHERAPVC